MRCAVLASVALLAGCTVGPDYRTPAQLPPTALKLSEVDVAKVSPSPLPPHWWRLFDDPDLDRLVERALVHNTDLRQAVEEMLSEAQHVTRALLGAGEPADPDGWPEA